MLSLVVPLVDPVETFTGTRVESPTAKVTLEPE